MANELLQLPQGGEVITALFSLDESGKTPDMDKLLEQVEQVAKSLNTFDPDTKDGRKELISLAAKVTKTKTALDRLGEQKSKALKEQAKVIDGIRTGAKQRLADLSEAIRKPVTEFENAEKERVAKLEQQLADLREARVIPVGTSLESIQGRLAWVRQIDPATFQEFAEDAKTAAVEALAALEAAQAAETKRLADEKELAELRAAAAEKQAAPSDDLKDAGEHSAGEGETSEKTEPVTPQGSAPDTAFANAKYMLMTEVPQLDDATAGAVIEAIIAQKVSHLRFVQQA